MKIWCNHEIADSSSISLHDDYWPDGTGIFETLRTSGNKVYELSRHMRRALDGAQRKGFSIPSEDLIRSAIYKLLEIEPHESGRLRLMFSSNRFLAVHLDYVAPLQPARIGVWSERYEKSGFVIKSFPYTQRLSISERAKKLGFDEVICSNTDGEITEGAVSNLLFRIGNRWVTTPLGSGVLPGIIRGIIIEKCGVKVENLLESQIQEVQSAFIISSLKIAQAVSHIDGREIQIDATTKDFEREIRSTVQLDSVL